MTDHLANIELLGSVVVPVNIHIVCVTHNALYPQQSGVDIVECVCCVCVPTDRPGDTVRFEFFVLGVSNPDTFF